MARFHHARSFLVLSLIALASSANTAVTPFAGILSVTFATNASHLTSTVAVTGDYAGSFGVSSGGMVGPIVSCYVTPGTASSAVCSDVDGNYGVALASPQVSQIVAASTSTGAWEVTVATPLSRLGATPGASTSMMFAYTTWNSGASLPNKHANNAKLIQAVTLPSTAGVSTTASPTGTVSTTTAPATTTAAPSNVLRTLTMSVLGGNLGARISFNSSTVTVVMTILGGLGGTIGFAPSGMAGNMVSCYGGSSGTGSDALCVDLNGFSFGVSKPSLVYSTLHSATVNSTAAVLVVTTPRSRLPSLADECRVIFARTPFITGSDLPSQHGTGDGDHGFAAVNFISGSVTLINTPFTARGLAYLIVGVVGGGLLVVATALVRVVGVKPSPTQIMAAQLFAALVILGMVAVVVVLAHKDFSDGLTLQPQFRAFGEASAFIFSMILIPTTKHVGLGVLVGSSFERMLFLHPLLAMILIVTMTTHMGGMFAMFDEPADLFKSTQNVFGFVAWLLLLCVAFPAMFLRRKNYNVFRATHTLFIAVLLFAALHHPDLWPMLLPGGCLWVIDLALRIYHASAADAKVRDLHYDERSGVITLRLSVRWTSAPEPGSYAFLLIPSISKIMHPFTVALAGEPDSVDAGRRIATFFIKSNGGATFTGDLASYVKCSLAPDSLNMSVFGPHGRLQVPLEDCRHVVLVSGGIGVTPMLSILEHVATNAGALSLLVELTFIWVARDEAIFDLMKGSVDGLVAICGTKVKVNVLLYSTSGSRIHRMNIEEPAADTRQIELLMQSPHAAENKPDARVTHGRPNFPELFTKIQPEGVGCYLCGPAPLMDTASSAAADQGFWIHKETFEF